VLLTLQASEVTPDWMPRETEVQTWAGIDETLRQRVPAEAAGRRQ
jgi:hypothetical protein